MLVLIDLDNTLNDRAAAVAAWIDEFCTANGLPADAPGWMIDNDADGYGDRGAVFHAVRARFGLDRPADELLADYRRGARQHLRAVPGAHRCLLDLRSAGLTIVIVSNGAGRAQQHKIDALGFRDLVDGVVVSEEVGAAKPVARIFELAAETAGVPLEGSWVVGDSGPHDIEGANRLGLRSIWIRRGRTWNPDLDPPTASVDTLDEVAPIVAAADGADGR